MALFHNGFFFRKRFYYLEDIDMNIPPSQSRREGTTEGGERSTLSLGSQVWLYTLFMSKVQNLKKGQSKGII